MSINMKYNKDDIRRYVDGITTLDESKRILEFIQTSEGVSALEEQLDNDINASMTQQKVSSESRPIVPFRKISYNTVHSKKTINIKRLGLIAASIMLPVLISTGVFLHMKNNVDIEYVEVYVPRGEKHQIFFQDGSHVWLSADSKLSFPKKFSQKQREVKLEGEAYFEVESNNNIPFIVNLENMHIKVTGTQFNVRAYSDLNEVITTLDQGKIAVHSDLNNKVCEVEPGQQISFDKNTGKMQIRRMTNSAINSKWREGYIKFQNTPLRNVTAELSRQFDINFKIMDKSIENTLFTISFHEQDLPHLLSELQLIAPVQFTIKDREVEVRPLK